MQYELAKQKLRVYALYFIAEGDWALAMIWENCPLRRLGGMR